MLTDSDLPLKQIAHQAGFSSVQYMTRTFHAVVGRTPGAYRRGMRS
jgi:AraC-like DNA-binding protein